MKNKQKEWRPSWYDDETKSNGSDDKTILAKILEEENGDNKDSDRKWNSKWNLSIEDEDLGDSDVSIAEQEVESPDLSKTHSKNYKILSDSFERESKEKKLKGNRNDARKNTLLDMIT